MKGLVTQENDEHSLIVHVLMNRDLLMKIFDNMSDVYVVRALLSMNTYMNRGMKHCLAQKSLSECLVCPLRRNYLCDFLTFRPTSPRLQSVIHVIHHVAFVASFRVLVKRAKD